MPTSGELWYRGPTVVRGYWQKPEATAAQVLDGDTADVAFVVARGSADDALVAEGRARYPDPGEFARRLERAGLTEATYPAWARRQASIQNLLAKVLAPVRVTEADVHAHYDPARLHERAAAWGERLRPHVADTTTLVQDALRAGEHVLLEGAQGDRKSVV